MGEPHQSVANMLFPSEANTSPPSTYQDQRGYTYMVAAMVIPKNIFAAKVVWSNRNVSETKM